MDARQTMDAQQVASARSFRKGRRTALAAAALWAGLMFILFRVPAEAPPDVRPAPPQVLWLSDQWMNDPASRIRHSVWSPVAFALPTPAGFSRPLHAQRIASGPPMQSQPHATGFWEREAPPVEELPGVLWLPGGETADWNKQQGSSPFSSVFPPRSREAESPQLIFAGEWESRLFSGLDLNFALWTNTAWSAEVEVRFDAYGIPESVLLVNSSGMPPVDGRIARTVRAWRLLDEAAARSGRVAWVVPAAASTPPLSSPSSLPQSTASAASASTGEGAP